MGLVPDIIMEEMYDDSQLMSSDNLENVISFGGIANQSDESQNIHTFGNH